jgi:hypothetical protein
MVYFSEFSFQTTIFQLFYFKGQRNGIAHRYRYLTPITGKTALNIEEFQKKRRILMITQGHFDHEDDNNYFFTY